MKKLKGTAISTTEPPKDLLWIDGKQIKFFLNGKWRSLKDFEGSVLNIDLIDLSIVITYTDKDGNEKTKSLDIGKFINEDELILEVTYAELKALRDNAKLIPGMQYKITDYETTINITKYPNVRAADNYFDIIITANSNNTLNENARACKRFNTSYFNNGEVEKWQIKYSLDADNYDWVPSDHKGIIYYMKDGNNNEAEFDFKNLQFKRWLVTASTVRTIVNKYVAPESSYEDCSVSSLFAYLYLFNSLNDVASDGSRGIGGIIKECSVKSLNNGSSVKLPNVVVTGGSSLLVTILESTNALTVWLGYMSKLINCSGIIKSCSRSDIYFVRGVLGLVEHSIIYGNLKGQACIGGIQDSEVQFAFSFRTGAIFDCVCRFNVVCDITIIPNISVSTLEFSNGNLVALYKNTTITIDSTESTIYKVLAKVVLDPNSSFFLNLQNHTVNINGTSPYVETTIKNNSTGTDLIVNVDNG